MNPPLVRCIAGIPTIPRPCRIPFVLLFTLTVSCGGQISSTEPLIPTGFGVMAAILRSADCPLSRARSGPSSAR